MPSRPPLRSLPVPSPNFLIIGAQKSGSSWLATHLGRHPEVYMPDSEVHFFDKAQHFEKGQAWYEVHFADAEANQRVGEKTPDYLWTTSDGAEGHRAGVHERIHAMYPNAKLLVTLRNPVQRAVSALNHLIRTGRISPMESADALLLGSKKHLTRPHGVLRKGFYHEQIQAYLERFDRDQFLFLIFEEDIIAHPEDTLSRLRSFLGLSADFLADEAALSRKVNAHGLSAFGLLLRYYTPLPRLVVKGIDLPFSAHKITSSHDVMLRLYDLYADANEQLFDFLGRRPTSWLKSTYLRKHESQLR